MADTNNTKPEDSEESRKITAGKDYFEHVEGDVYTGPVNIHQHVSPQEKQAQTESQQALKEFEALLQTSDLKTLRAQFQPLDAYLVAMQHQHSTIKILNMPSPISLKDIFTRVDVLSKPSMCRHISQDHLEQIYLGKASFGEVVEKGKNALQVIREHQRLFILGKPGAGKTTLLKYTVLATIEGTLTDEKILIPMSIPLREWADTEQSLLAFLTNQFRICNFPDAQPFIKCILKAGKAIVLFDGLDEVSKQEGQQDRLIQELVRFSREYGQNHLVITCRIAASEYTFEDFTDVEIADFNNEQIWGFVTRWFADDPSTAKRFLKEFDQKEKKHLRDLGKTPLLLTLLCIAFEENRSFPLQRAALYEEALNVLLRKWDTSRKIDRDEIYRGLNLRRKHQMFARIAAETFENGEYLFEQRQLEKKIVNYLQNLPSIDKCEDIDEGVTLKAIEAQHGIFVERAQHLYSFSHISFQEYFTAEYVIEYALEGSLHGLIQNHFRDKRWREVFLLTAEMLDSADKFFQIFLLAVDNLITEDERLVRLLKKVEPEAGKISLEGMRPVEKRMQVMALFLDIAHALDPIVLNHVRGRAYALAFTHTHPHFCTEILARARVHAHVYALDHALSHARAEALARADTHKLDYAHHYARTYAHEAYEHYNIALKLSETLTMIELHRALADLHLPPEVGADETWKTFADTIFNLFCAYRSLEDYTFTEEQARHLIQYLETTKLLLDCLNLAAVSDRAAIEDRLLRPPQSST